MFLRMTAAALPLLISLLAAICARAAIVGPPVKWSVPSTTEVVDQFLLEADGVLVVLVNGSVGGVMPLLLAVNATAPKPSVVVPSLSICQFDDGKKFLVPMLNGTFLVVCSSSGNGTNLSAVRYVAGRGFEVLFSRFSNDSILSDANAFQYPPAALRSLLIPAWNASVFELEIATWKLQHVPLPKLGRQQVCGGFVAADQSYAVIQAIDPDMPESTDLSNSTYMGPLPLLQGLKKLPMPAIAKVQTGPYIMVNLANASALAVLITRVTANLTYFLTRALRTTPLF
jgi:hypothetical protein